jgi:hypothetical protein
MKLDLPDPWVPGMGLLNSSMLQLDGLLPPTIWLQGKDQNLGILDDPWLQKSCSYLE